MKKLSIRDQIVTAIFIQVILYFLVYLGYYFIIYKTNFYNDKTLLANLIVIVPLILLFLVLTTKIIEKSVKQIQDINKSLNDFYKADFNELILNSKNKNLKNINENLYKLQQQTLHDIEELKQKNLEILDLINKQKESYVERNKIIASLSHDLKTPLTVIQTTIYAIKDGVISEDQLEKEYNNISTQIDKTINMLQRMLAVFKKEQEIEEANIEEFNITPVIDENILSLKKLFEKYEDTLNINYFGNPIVKLDKNHFNQIINNLLVNALSHSPNKSVISITLLDKRDYYELSITNSGVEIAENELENIFKPFYKLDLSRKNEEAIGNGLGLYIVKELCMKNNIEIIAKSSNNETSFVLDIKKG